MAREDEITIEGAHVIWRNFDGRETQYNRAGDRNFTIVLDKRLAEELTRTGWNVRYTKPREEGDEPKPILEVKVSYKGKPPRIIMLTSRGRNPLDESMVGMLDFVEIDNVDVTLNPYDWEVNGNSGRKAYLKTMYIKIVEDPLDIKYAEDDPTAPGPDFEP